MTYNYRKTEYKVLQGLWWYGTQCEILKGIRAASGTVIIVIPTASSSWGWLFTVTSWWARWYLKSPASGLFAQPFVQAQIKEKLGVSGLCERNPTVIIGFP